jgi:hypothetical protein
MSATSTSPLELAGYDVDVVRRDFPILSRRFGGRPLAYLDSANTSQKPQQVIDAISDHYAQHNANVARAMHSLALRRARPTRTPATRWPRSSVPATATRSSSPGTRPRR